MDACSVTDESHLAEEQHVKKTHKRRSSIFSSRPLQICDEQDFVVSSGDDAKDGCSTPKEPQEQDMVEEKEVFDLQQYINNLRRERKQWQELWKERKRKKRHLTKQTATVDSRGQTLDLSVLPSAEKSFIEARPNYEHICKNINALSAMVVKATTLSQTVHELDNRFREKMEKNIQRTRKEIIQLSESLPLSLP